MAPPLLPFTRLVLCSRCSEHVKNSDPECPHCGAALAGSAVARAAATVVMAGLLGACSGIEPAYGIAFETDPLATGTSTGTGTGTGTGTETDTSSGTTTDEPTSTGTSSTGSTDTGEQTSTETGSSDDSGSDTGATTTAEPEYGVPGTTTAEPDYGVPGTT